MVKNPTPNKIPIKKLKQKKNLKKKSLIILKWTIMRLWKPLHQQMKSSSKLPI